MDRGAWQATVHGVARVGHDLVTNPPPPSMSSHGLIAHFFFMLNGIPLSGCAVVYSFILLLRDVLVASTFGEL